MQFQQTAKEGAGDEAWARSTYWQQQVQLAQLSRQTNSPHSYARSAALKSRSSGAQGNIPMTVTELALQFVQQSQQASSTAGVSNQLTPIKGVAKMSANGGNGGGAGGAFNMNPQQRKDEMEEERQRRINEEINKQFWTAVDLSGQGLQRLTPKLFNYDFLQKLYLNHNKLVALPPAITKLSQLKVLDLSDNLLTELPPELGFVFTLKYLFLFDNKIQNLPYEFGSLFQLEVLGLEGNPISDRTRELLAREGTRGVVQDLRERAPVKQASPPREWLEFEEPAADRGPFKVMSYNTLCDRYATPQLYAYTQSWALAWKYRRELLKDEIFSYDSDVVCLQEVDGTSYDGFWRESLGPRGYDSQYWPKTRARTMSELDAKRVDGCATFYKKDRLRYVEHYIIEYNALALRKDDLKKTEDIYNRIMTKDNIGLVTVFERVDAPGQLLVVANTHLHWDPEFKDVKLVQVALLLEELERIVGLYASNSTPEGSKFPRYTDIKSVPLLICGDFNSTWDSGVYQLFAQGDVSSKHPDLEGRIYGRYTEDGIHHKFSLRSAYADVNNMPFTNYTPNFVQVIDYIWFSTSALSVTGALGQIDPDYTKNFVGFPNPHHPSDHIPLVAQLTFKKVKEGGQHAKPNFGTSSSRKT